MDDNESTSFLIVLIPETPPSPPPPPKKKSLPGRVLKGHSFPKSCNAGNAPPLPNKRNFQLINYLDKPTTTNPPPLPPGTPGALLSLPCHNINQLRAASIQLIGHAIYLCEERISKRIQSRFKDNVLEKCLPLEFHKTCQIIEEFKQKCKQIDECGQQQQQQSRSQCQTIIQQITNKFISKFTEARQRELSATIDAEPWKPAHINSNIQQIVDCYVQDGVLTTDTNNETINNNEDEEPKEMLKLKDEEFIVIGSALLLINILASYSDLLRLFPTAGMELSMDVVQCLKLFNSRTCQLILGAGARQLVGLKSINVKHLGIFLELILQNLKQVCKFETRLQI
ncbi:unnamed protein product [Meloidogyne enterolobii]|uniref:Uncharacterized protein n=1 Tax=Meloidogyne enterolobii TaxID=390850 RepID=A0ACB0XZQ2_MELEN